ncbi:hypothetical protein FQZ97_842220 [compost metagenome]
MMPMAIPLYTVCSWFVYYQEKERRDLGQENSPRARQPETRSSFEMLQLTASVPRQMAACLNRIPDNRACSPTMLNS